jgi:uncharacterized membrane protein
VTSSRSRLMLIILSVLIMATLLLAVPSMAFAQEEEENTEEEAQEPEPEPETLEFDISYGEVTNFGKKGTIYGFEATVTYDGEEEKYFDIVEDLPPGWDMDVNPGTQAIDVPLILLRPGSPETLKVKCETLVDQEPGEYMFKITLVSAVEGDELEGSAEFTGIVKPDGALELAASTERLNTEVRAGKENIYTIIVKNTGSAPVEDISLSSSGEPEGWLVELQDRIDFVEVGQEVEVEVMIAPPERTISGNYSISFNASSEDGNDSLQIRTIVETPLIWKIVGIGIIALVIAGIAIIFERLGRR